MWPLPGAYIRKCQRTRFHISSFLKNNFEISERELRGPILFFFLSKKDRSSSDHDSPAAGVHLDALPAATDSLGDLMKIGREFR